MGFVMLFISTVFATTAVLAASLSYKSYKFAHRDKSLLDAISAVWLLGVTALMAWATYGAVVAWSQLEM